jgi:ABC-2 type transport system ATP-binding protein
MMDRPSPLCLHDVAKRWEKREPCVLDGVDLVLEPGSATLVRGRNGVGKTTLLRIAAGLIEPERGLAQARGMSARANPGRYQRLVSFLPAGDRGLYARLSVRRQLEFWARVALLPRRRVRAAVEDALDRFQLRELERRRVDRLSMGQRQRLRIAMTFLGNPETVLLDEPLTSLDSEGGEILEEALDDLLGSGGCVLWCAPTGDRLGRPFDASWSLEGGRLVAEAERLVAA